MADPSQLSSLIEKLKSLRENRGATAGEATAAALKIGQLVMKYDLTIEGGATPSQHKPQGQDYKHYPDTREQGEQYEDDYDAGPSQTWGHTAKAIYVFVEEFGEAFWIPRSVLRGYCKDWMKDDNGPLHVARWWAKKQDWYD